MVKKSTLTAVLCAGALFFTSINAVSVSASSLVLKKGMRGDSVVQLQSDLKELGYFNANTTGYYGSITTAAVLNYQKKQGLKVDGIAGPQTFAALRNDLNKGQILSLSAQASRGSDVRNENYALSWFGTVDKIFSRGKEAVVYDIDTGLSFKIKRTYGTNHADCEPLTLQDTAIMKKIYSGSWSWARRAVIVSFDDYKIAASMAGMPHAGVENAAANIVVSNRSQGYGTGVNLDAVKGNGMSGHFDIHFLGSKTHGTNRVDENHQKMVKKASDWANANY